jgi:beta-galactosidase
VNGATHFGYNIYSAPIDTLPIKYDSLPMVNTPTFYKYVFNAEEVCDTVLHPVGFERGVAFINGFNLGRHWNIENSENKLFVPAPFIKKGKNEIVIFDVMPTGAEKSVRLSEF